MSEDEAYDLDRDNHPEDAMKPWRHPDYPIFRKPSLWERFINWFSRWDRT